MQPLAPVQLRRMLAAGLLQDRERLALWLPVAFGAGAVSYFQLAEEPPAFWPVAMAIAGLALLRLTRALPALPLAAIGLILFAAGWGWSQLSTQLSAAPMLPGEAWGVQVEGRVVDLDPREGAAVRVVLDQLRIEDLAPEETPERIRITYRSSEGPVRPGDMLRARAVLRTPSPPVAAGGYDFQREAWFNQIGAVGFALGSVAVASGDAADGGWSLELAVENLRRAIAEEIGQALDGPVGALAIALVVGERGTITKADTDAMRAAGLSHVIAISGLNIGIVAGFVFWTVRAALALAPPIAVRYPIKKWAAIAGLASALVYTLVAGLTPPTLRSFLMVAIALLAMMIDRNPISMRLLGVAALTVMLMSPSTVLGPSFQLSFAAVIALVAAFEWVDARRSLIAAKSGDPRSRFLVYLGAVTYSSLIATVATTPFSLFHFQQVALYGVIANLLAIPLMAFWVMPLLAIGCVVAPLGLGDLGFIPAGWGIEAIRIVAHIIADWPGAVFHAPAADSWTLGLITAGGLWLCLLHSRLRWLGLAPAAVGLGAMLAPPPPAIFVSGFGAPFAVLSADTESLWVPSLRRDRFTTTSWARLAGLDQERNLAELPQGEADGGSLRCDGFGCVVVVEGERIAIAREFDALDADCSRADLVIQLFPGGRFCPSGVPTIRYLDLFIDGAHTLSVDRDGEIAIDTVGAARGHRPWVVTNR